MERLKKYLKDMTTPKHCGNRFSIYYWQERILLNLLLACVIFGFVVYFPSVALSIKENLWIIAITDTLIYMYILFLFFYPGVSYNVKAFSFCAISYLLGLTLLSVLGPFGAGPVWLFTFPVLTGLFLGFKISVFALIINTITITVTGFLILKGFFGWGMTVINPLEKWIVTSLNFMLLNVIVVLSVTSILKGLHESLNNHIQLQNQLNRARKMEALGLLAGGVAHDLNNILSAIMGYPDLILLELDENSPLTESLLAIKSSGQKAAEIIQDMLTLSRRGVTTKEVINLSEIVFKFTKAPECQKILSYHPDSNIKIRLAAKNPFIIGSPVHLSKTVMNLVYNAAEAQTSGGTITISTENVVVEFPIKAYTQVEPGEYVILKVEDHGMGIAESDLERIFEPFFTKKVMGRSGTGLGMAVVWGTVQDHEGYIDIKSKVDSGTTFTLYFPVTHQKKDKPPADVSFADYIGNGEHLLVVDDLKEQREIVTAMLTKLNYKVSSVESGERAVEFIKTTSADLIILDMIMDPGMDGLETYKNLIQINPDQKVVIASGFSETDRVKEMMTLGASQYIKKPYGLQQIGIAVKNVLLSKNSLKIT
ncbi:MAG: response regulator [Desulfamplus sp.]|nr:response regulator [Desulfamplus sp.]